MPLNFVKALFWLLLMSTVIVFWISIRTTEDAVYYSILALILWVMTYGTHKWMKAQKNKDVE